MKKLYKEDLLTLKDAVKFINEANIQKEDLVGIFKEGREGSKYYSVLYYGERKV